MIAPEPGQNLEQEAVARGDGAIHPDFATEFTRLLHQFIANSIPITQGVPGIVEEQSAGMGQGYAAVITLKQSHAEFVFQPSDTAAQRRRTHMAGLAGPAKMQAVGQVDELLQRPCIHDYIIA